jgi:hypothetical protein
MSTEDPTHSKKRRISPSPPACSFSSTPSLPSALSVLTAGPPSTTHAVANGNENAVNGNKAKGKGKGKEEDKIGFESVLARLQQDSESLALGVHRGGKGG